MKALVISDKRVGHVSQSEAFCRFLSYEATFLHVSYRFRFLKILSYFFDKISLYIKIFTCKEIQGQFDLIVSVGSSTYYPAIYFSKSLHLPLIALMYPRGYGLKNFKFIFAGAHDNPLNLPNIIKTPTNFSYVEKSGVFTPKKKAIGIVLGGDNKVFTMDKKEIKKALLKIREDFYNYEIAITSSPRTPKEVEEIIRGIDFDFKIIYSEDKRNPIGDFLFTCKEVFLTIDSTSMISSAISFGSANICIIPLQTKNTTNKYQRFADNLVAKDYAYYFGKKPKKCKKFDIQKVLEAVKL